MTELERARQAIELVVISLRMRGKHETAKALENFEENLKLQFLVQSNTTKNVAATKPKPKRKRVKSGHGDNS